jgi:hypothetical protein
MFSMTVTMLSGWGRGGKGKGTASRLWVWSAALADKPSAHKRARPCQSVRSTPDSAAPLLPTMP